MTERPKELDQVRTDRLYYQQHYQELLRQHPEQWVAIYHHQLVGADADLDALLGGLKETGVPATHAFIDHVTAKDDVFILSA
jgi:hypothetical protein